MDLAARTLLGFLVLAVLLVIALFVPAGTFAYWQAWVCIAVFFISSGLITLWLWNHDRQLLERRVLGGPVAEQSTTQRVIQSVASIAFLLVFVVPALDRRFGWSSVPTPIVLVADILIASGFAIVFLVFRENTYTAATIQVASEQKVISSGPYAVVRHPMYAGALLMLLAVPVALDSWWGLITFVPISLVIVWRLLDEERFLSANLPGYTEYCNGVRWRLIPHIC